jgi:cobalt/nickel transport system permease protein
VGAVHIPDGFIDAPTSIGAAALAGGGLRAAIGRSAESLQERGAPLAGLVASFVFAAQMLNFPVAAGTSGHLIGGVLAAVLVGPWAGAVCIAVVLLVQALFADGGLTALGLNILNMALVACVGGYGLFVLARRVLGRSRRSVVVASGIAAGVSVLLAAGACVLEYAIGGTSGVSLTTVAGTVLGVHVLIGIGEGVITAMTVATVLSVRPDLVYGAKDLIDTGTYAPGRELESVS